jgi:hypothetical protein
MKLRENKIMLFASGHTQTAACADYSTTRLSRFPDIFLDGFAQQNSPVPPQTPGAALNMAAGRRVLN